MEQTSRHIIALIPLRGGSKSIPLKNIKEIAGRPLVYWVLDAVCGCDSIDTVYVSTDSDLIRDVIKNYGSKRIEVVGRSIDAATDYASTESVMLEFARDKKFSDIVLAQATSPLLESIHLKEGVQKYLECSVDSLLSVVRQKRFIWKETSKGIIKPFNYDPLKRPRRQDWEGFLVENGSFYITSRKNLQKYLSRVSGKIAYYEMPAQTYVELDDLSDWTMTEALLLEKKTGRLSPILVNKLKNIKLLVMDVDGVLTDAGMFYNESGDEIKKFNTRDGKGIEIIKSIGIKTAFITSEKTALVEKRSKKLKIDFLMQGIKDKAEALRELIKSNGLSFEEVAYIGDDINDTEAMKMSGFSATPADGVSVNKKIVSYICINKGGEGCVREVCNFLVEAKSA